jgi:hypothetical protein
MGLQQAWTIPVEEGIQIAHEPEPISLLHNMSHKEDLPRYVMSSLEVLESARE